MECGRKQRTKYPKDTHAHTGRTENLQITLPRNKIKNFCCEADHRATQPLIIKLHAIIHYRLMSLLTYFNVFEK